MHKTNPAAMPYGCSSGETEDSVGCHVRYHEAVGCLMYLMTATRPHIAYAVLPAARVKDRPTEADWMDDERILSICGEQTIMVCCMGLVTVRKS